MATILVVDDDRDFCVALCNSLEGLLGHTVVVAHDGTTALRMMRQAPADIVVTDIFMPGRDGLELISELKRAHQGVDIIAMSGSAGRRASAGDGAYQLVAARALGAMLAIAKPFDLRRLASAIDAVLAGRLGGRLAGAAHPPQAGLRPLGGGPTADHPA